MTTTLSFIDIVAVMMSLKCREAKTAPKRRSTIWGRKMLSEDDPVALLSPACLALAGGQTV